MSPSQNDEFNKRLAEKLRRQAEKRGADSPAAEAARIHSVPVTQEKRETRVTEKQKEQEK